MNCSGTFIANYSVPVSILQSRLLIKGRNIDIFEKSTILVL